MEGPIPDVIAKRIISTYLIPNFKNNDYYTGLDQATDAIIKLQAGQFVDELQNNSSNGKAGNIAIIVIIIVIIIIILSRRGRGGGGVINRRGSFFPPWWLWTLGNFGGGGGRGWSGGGGGSAVVAAALVVLEAEVLEVAAPAEAGNLRKRCCIRKSSSN